MSPERLPATTTPLVTKVQESHPVENHRARSTEKPADQLVPYTTRLPEELIDRLKLAVFKKQFKSQQEAVAAALDALLPPLE